jgi:hypothetical protein
MASVVAEKKVAEKKQAKIERILEFVSRSRRGIGIVPQPMVSVSGTTLIFNTAAVQTTDISDYQFAHGAIDPNNDKIIYLVLKEEEEDDFFTVRQDAKYTYAISCAYLLRRTRAISGDKFAVSQEDFNGKPMLVLTLLVK